MRVKLVLMGEQGQRTVYRLKKVPTIIGRGRDADLTLAHPLASRHHCELYEVDGTLCVRDLGSLNGTFVGDFRITEAALESGDLLTIGSAKFEVLVEKDPDKLMPPGKPKAASKAEDAEELEPLEEQTEAIPEAEEMEESFSDIDFMEADEPEAPAPPPSKPVPKKSPPAPATKSPAAQSPAAKSPPTKPAPSPAGNPKPGDALASSHSDLDLDNIGEGDEDEEEEHAGHPGPDDSGLNSFLRKL
ncbi:MAG: FHA domain-containing protein [Planctomycetes bacterium]|nr:FHA domain-containing protein [Planctomycetota bacterium]